MCVHRYWREDLTRTAPASNKYSSPTLYNPKTTKWLLRQHVGHFKCLYVVFRSHEIGISTLITRHPSIHPVQPDSVRALMIISFS